METFLGLVLNALAVISILALDLPLLAAEKDLLCRCGREGEYQIYTAWRFLSPKYFEEEYLRTYFARYLTYPETTEFDLLLIGDKKLLKGDYLFEVHQGIKPVKTAAPIARFRKIGRNAFFEFRDRSGKTGETILEGDDILCPTIEGVQARLATQVFDRINENVLSCAATYRRLTVVIPHLEALTMDQVAAICRRHGETLGPTLFSVWLYGSFHAAGHPNHDPFPSLTALSVEGYGEFAGRGVHFYFSVSGEEAKRGFLVKHDRVRRILATRDIEW